MGSDDFYPEERPAHRVIVEAFRIDPHPVTNTEFNRFAEATGYVTLAERVPDPALYPGADATNLVPGSLVFRQPRTRVPLADPRAWWACVPGACWRRPEGPGSDLRGRGDHPVVHVASEDAAAFAGWAGKSLPTEAEWEYAARGGLEGAAYAWGEEFAPGGRMLANSWQGEFPWENLRSDGYAGTSPVGAFPANGYGLHDMIGNVWEWTADDFALHPQSGKSCCMPRQAAANVDAAIPRKVVKGGSYLCAPNYCRRYRPAARQPQAIDSSASHIGFRCVLREKAR